MKNRERQPTEPDNMQFSVIIPLYNKEVTITRALWSVLNQTFQKFEIIVVNDGSSDNGPDIIKDFTDPRIRLVNQENQGVSAARNRGIAEAQNDLIAFLDADDEWLPEFLETIIELCKNFPDCSVFATQYYFCSSGGRRTRAIVKGLPPDYTEGKLTDYFNIASKSDPPLWTSAVSVEKKAITSINGFPAGIVSGEDLLTWARLAVKFQVAYSVKPGAVHYHPQTIADRPDRVPTYPDLVAISLKELLHICPPESKNNLRKYIALWHRMRAMIFLQSANRSSTLNEIILAVKLAPSLRLFVFFVIACLPGQLPVALINMIRRRKYEI